MPKSRYTSEDIERMKELYKKGVLLKSIAEEFKIHHTTIIYHVGLTNRHSMKKNDVSARGRDWRKNFPAKDPTKKYISTRLRTPKMYEKYLYLDRTTKFIRDEKGNIIEKKKIPFKTPISVWTGSPLAEKIKD